MKGNNYDNEWFMASIIYVLAYIITYWIWKLANWSIEFRSTPPPFQLVTVSTNLKQMNVMVIFFLRFFTQKCHSVINCLQRFLFHRHLTRLSPTLSSLVSCPSQAGHASSINWKVLKIFITNTWMTFRLYLHELLLDFVGFMDLVITLDFNFLGKMLNINPR
jgi:hypothetical protein